MHDNNQQIEDPRDSDCCFACSSICTTSRMVGRSILCSCTQSMLTKNTCIASSIGALTSLGSMIFTTPSLLQFVLSLAHWTKSKPSSPKSPTGFRPVTNSRRTTPKLYTSLFSSTFRVYAYSVKRKKEIHFVMVYVR